MSKSQWEGYDSLPFRYKKIIVKFDKADDTVKANMFNILQQEVEHLNSVLVYMGGYIESRA
jgi:hypothetical protein